MGFLDSGIGEGLNQASDTILNTGMQVMKFKQDKMIQEQHLAMEQDRIARENKLTDMKTAQLQEDIKLIDVDDQLDRLGFKSPEEKQWWYSQPEIQLDIEEVCGRKTLQKKKAIDHFLAIGKQPEKNIELGNIRANVYNKQIEQITQQLTNPESKLKPEQTETLTKQLEVLKQQRTALVNQVKMEQRKLNGQDKKPYKIGQILPQRTEGNRNITQQVVGYDDNDMPVLETISTAPRYKESSGGNKTDKERDKTARRIDEHIRVSYDNREKEIRTRIEKLTASGEKEDLKKVPELERILADINTQREKALSVKYQLLNGEIDKVEWGGKKERITTPKKYKTAEEVRSDFKTGKIKEVEATKILQSQFGMK